MVAVVVVVPVEVSSGGGVICRPCAFGVAGEPGAEFVAQCGGLETVRCAVLASDELGPFLPLSGPR